MHPVFLEKSPAATPISLVSATGFEAWLKTQEARAGKMAEATGFKGEAGKLMLVSNAEGGVGQVVLGTGEGTDSFILAPLPTSLPPGDYVLDNIPDGFNPETLALGWADGAYRFTRYRKNEEKPRRLVLPKVSTQTRSAARPRRSTGCATSSIRRPPTWARRKLPARPRRWPRNSARISRSPPARRWRRGYPMVHAVGKGADATAALYRDPLGKDGGKPHPKKLVIVGKGVAFDTGGLNIKTAPAWR